MGKSFFYRLRRRRYPVAERQVVDKGSDGRHHLHDRNRKANGRVERLNAQNPFVEVVTIRNLLKNKQQLVKINKVQRIQTSILSVKVTNGY